MRRGIAISTVMAIVPVLSGQPGPSVTWPHQASKAEQKRAEAAAKVIEPIDPRGEPKPAAYKAIAGPKVCLGYDQGEASCGLQTSVSSRSRPSMPRLLASFMLIAANVGLIPPPANAADSAIYEAYAVRYATLKGYPVSSLVQGAEKDRKLDIAMMVWVLKSPERTVLVDAGFYRPNYLEEWKSVADYTRPDKAVARLGIKPEDVSDVVITHTHWDHADGADLFPKARVWIQKAEYEHYTTQAKPEKVEPSGHLSALVRLHEAGSIRLVDGDNKEIIPGVTVYTGGKHTFESQYVGVNTRAGRMVIASDNMYLYENLDKHVPIAATLDARSNLAAQDRMRQIAAKPELIIPGHDPEVFVRFPKAWEGVARLD